MPKNSGVKMSTEIENSCILVVAAFLEYNSICSRVSERENGKCRLQYKYSWFICAHASIYLCSIPSGK
jgi:hypothetical protein